MSIASEVEDLQTNLANAKSAVTERGGVVSDSGLAGLAAEIKSIPSGGGEDPGDPEQPILTIYYYPSWEETWVVRNASECAVEIVNAEKVEAFYESTDDTSASLSFSFDDRTGRWRYQHDWEGEGYTAEELKGSLGIEVTLDEGADWAGFTLEWQVIVDKDGGTAEGKILTEKGLRSFCFRDENAFSGAFLWVEDHFISIPAKAIQEIYANSSPALDLSDAESLFAHCSNLERVNMGQSISKYGAYALTGTSAQTILVDASIVEYVGVGSFSYNKNLTVCSVPGDVVEIDNQAFSHNPNWETDEIYFAKAKRIGEAVFTDNNRLSCNVVFSAGSSTVIGSSFLSGCEAFNGIVQLFGVSEIGDWFMARCSSFGSGADGHLKGLECVRSVGMSFLSECKAFQGGVVFSRNCVLNVAYLLDGCSSINYVVLPDNMYSAQTDSRYAERTLYGCDSLLSVWAGNLGALCLRGSIDRRNSLTVTSDTAVAYTNGVRVYGNTMDSDDFLYDIDGERRLNPRTAMACASCASGTKAPDPLDASSLCNLLGASINNALYGYSWTQSIREDDTVKIRTWVYRQLPPSANEDGWALVSETTVPYSS